jgi:glyoxylase-like metal-dependent hydrolase (beta-lactamase superfamily II)
MREILSNLLSWDRFSETHGYDFHGTLALHPEGNLCIDPVEPDDEAWARLTEEGVARILITNRNHVRAANSVAKRTGARVGIHPADAAYARGQGLQIDEDLEPGERVGPFEVVAVPGKSPGEIALHDPVRRLLVVGDAVVGNPPGELSLLPGRVIDDLPLLRRSVRALLDLDLESLIVGDGVSILEGAHAHLARLVAGFPD